MVARDLLRELEGRRVRLLLEGGQLVARGPSGGITPELAGQIKTQRDALLRELQGEEGECLSPLPEPLVRLIRAAVSPGLPYPASLGHGMVPSLGEYVLASAALYAAGVEPARQLQALWAAREVWLA